MHLTKNITMELTENDVKEIIAEYVRDKWKCINSGPKDVTIKVEKEWRGYGLGEIPVYVCKGASVKCKIE